jgi:CubicO group peptidase (beta-lactamase class C family)
MSAPLDSILCLTLVTLFGVQVSAQSPPTPKASRESDLQSQLAQKAPQWLKQYDVPSVAVAYIEKGKVAWTAVYGNQSPGVPATGKTLYNVASLTKPISAEVILQLASKGKLSLDEPLSTFWIDPDVKDNAWNQLLTPRLCLSHQTGFPNWRDQNSVLKFQWKPGTSTGYSGEGYDYVARFAEKKMGQPFETLAKEYVFDPIGIKDTSYTARDWYAGRLAVAQGPKGEVEPKTQSTWTAADLLRTTIGDYAKFVVSVMHKDGLTDNIATEQMTITRNLASAEKLQELCAEAKVSPPSPCQGTGGLGLGWEILVINGETIIDHSGGDWGVHTLVFYLPQRQLGMVLFTNGDNGSKVIREIVSLAYHNPLFLATL